MFDDVGNSLKGLAKVFCWVGIISCILFGSVVASFLQDYAALAAILFILIACVGSFVCCMISLVVVGYGIIVEDHENKVKSLANERASNNKRTHTNSIDPRKFKSEMKGMCGVCGRNSIPVCLSEIRDEDEKIELFACELCFEEHNCRRVKK